MGTREQRAAVAYTELWHAARDAATAIVEHISGPGVTYPPQPPAKTLQIEIARGSLVPHPFRAAEAYRDGWPPEMLLSAANALPEVPHVGRRRSLIRAFAWLVDTEERHAYDGQWITLIPSYAPDAATLRRAIGNARLWLESYMDSLHQMTASKLLVFTAVEVVFWTQGPWAARL